MAEDIKKLINGRGTIKARITNFQKYMDTIKGIEPEKITKQVLGELTLKLTRFQELLSYFDEVQAKIEILSPSEDQIQERDNIENDFCRLISSAQVIIEASQKPEHHAENKSISGGSTSSHKNFNIKLPTINIPSFDGTYSKWLEFRDTFDSLVNKNDSIPQINKFHYLRSSLDGGAAVVIKALEFTAENYNVAWELLCDRYNNTRLLVNNHLKALFTFDTINKESYKSIRYMVDYFTKNLRALNTLKEPTEHWDTLIIFMMTAKLDSTTGRKWEEHRNTLVHSPTLAEFHQFLRNRADVLETMQFNKTDNTKGDKNFYSKDVKTSKSFVASSNSSSNGTSTNKPCAICNQNHFVHECENFKNMNIESRLGQVSKYNLCLNCLRPGHLPSRCFRGPCKICKRKHNTLVHKQSQNNNKIQNNDSSNNTQNSSPIVLSAMMPNQVLLCTAQVELFDEINNKTYIAKALLDSGSQSSFVTEYLQNKINLPCSTKTPINVSGINNTIINTSKYCDLQIKSRLNSFRIGVSCLVIPHITNKLPCVEIDPTQLNLPSDIQLADPSFFSPSEIQILLGSDVFWEIINPNQIKLGRNKPTLQDSNFGWLVAGPTGGNTQSPTAVCNFSQDLQKSISKFWEIEELPSLNKPILSKVEKFCENHFLENTKRLTDGRFSVKIPLKESPEAALGDSFNIAKKRYFNLETKLNKFPQLKEEYKQFIYEYERLGHLCQTSRPSFGYYLPHHAVIRTESETTRLRVVFDASCKTTSGKSFNEIQLVGPVVQDDLLSILLRFRQNAYVVTGDIEKMYRQIIVDESQRHLQLILWRDDSSQPLRVLQLNTVTYGTASAPFLSTRCLLQLSKECSNDPDVATVIEHDFYVDDLNTSSNSKLHLQNIVNGVVIKLAEAGFPLRKFRTNAPDIFENISITNQSQDFSKESTVLGLKWSPQTDTLKFSTKIEAVPKVTKRNILSTSSKIFDPLGLLSATTILPKVLLQRLWLLKSGWDEPIPEQIRSEWQEFTSMLHCLSTFEVARHVVCEAPNSIEIHCFVDASQMAYGTCLYIRSLDDVGKCTIRLLCAKAKVAPLKPELTIPRLELMGALLGSRLLTKVLQSLRHKDIQFSRCILWTDSTIVLGWINTQPKTLKTFVCNRIQEIRELTAQWEWRYVPTHDNPADLASRGIKPQHLKDCNLWWKGASFLTHPEDKWPQYTPSMITLPETKVSLNIQCEPSFIQFNNYSNLHKLQRIFGYVLRFINNAKHKNKITGVLTSSELRQSLHLLAKCSQRDSFAKDIHSLQTLGSVNYKSNILPLHPFLDKEGILRVGGRIQSASVSYNKKHPILIDSKHPFTILLFAKEHLRLLHCGPQQLLCSIRDVFWPTGGRTLATRTVKKCVQCVRIKGKTIQPVMGNLPLPRVNPASPFETCGTDFAGPFLISSRKGRGSRTTKCYLCLFVCFSTKALHLEVVSDLSTNAFILCLRRFISRRGKPHTIYCDNGKNFVGAKGELNRMLRSANDSVTIFSASEGINFKFIPAYAPNFGGIWEAGVKAAKFHLKRIAGNSSLTFEEISTLFAQIEAILNSRPLTPMSADPSDFSPLTPGHFLIGRPLSSLPSPVTEKLSLNRYQHLEKLRQHFWARWSQEFLSELQRRVKWTQDKGQQVKIGDMVVVKDSQLPPMKWILGRIHHLYTGHDDGVCRVADIITSKGTIRRALTKVCVLPVEESQELLGTSGFQGGAVC